ncbi:Prefoldin subunit 3 [Penicillium herquei]|uniref:Prefoldin subunit 3 n=1 Tax=Penicillium malachiteum TaxID=1324776 RepID=A0AAD6MQH8_9EURO|nr:Prefoldin subunit 3 [Penicillium herquei]KAJ5703492.1 Prefoldin subunit 3 [Penicillium malachiteum]KAJ5724101.1 Prefoldin subunit 3 [Penicillium malachiteum]
MADSKSKGPVTAQTNARGIPVAPFIDNVDEYVSSRAEVEGTLRRFQEMISKYQFMEVNSQKRGQGLREKIPDIKKTLEMVRFLKLRKESNPDTDIETNFELNDTLYARASISPADTEEVYLWLGANVMLAYPLDEAENMLAEKLSAAETSLANCEEDLEFLREQITTLEVATARVYNWDVVQRRKEKAEGKGDDEETSRPG